MFGSEHYLADSEPPLSYDVVVGIWQWRGCDSEGIKLRKYIKEDASDCPRITNGRIDESGGLDQSIANSATWLIALQTI